MEYTRIQAFTKAKIGEIRKSGAIVDDYFWRLGIRFSNEVPKDCFLVIDITLNSINGEIEEWGQCGHEIDPFSVGNNKVVRLKFSESYIESL